MTYPSILTIWDGCEETGAAFDIARRFAKRWSSHLEIGCFGVDRLPTGFYAVELAHEVAYDFFGEAKREAASLAQDARDMIGEDDFNWNVRAVAMRFAELPDIVGKAGWFQDLIILPQPFGRKDEELPEAILDAALFEAPAPTLTIPADWSKDVGETILIAWNGSLEAARALRAAMPLIEKAKHVNAVLVDANARREGSADPGAALGAMLSRHGADAEISLLHSDRGSVAETLRQRAKDIGADLIVMGAYGHSRFRERMIGGATRDMLKAAETPIFFAR